MGSLYALLIGINTYSFKPLEGCINDVNAVEEYLQHAYGSRTDFDLIIKRITDEANSAIKPTKNEIIDSFVFFNEAKDGDVCLVYYSGHGSYTPAPIEFWTEFDGMNESIVCLDSREPGGYDLIDKELGVIIWKYFGKKTGVHTVIITDCCNSGGITKAAGEQPGLIIRTASHSGPPLKLEAYFGFGEQSGNDEAYEWSEDHSRITVKQGAHIHLAACYAHELSQELFIDGIKRGAFTYSLLKTLYKTGGLVTYKELIDKTSILVRNLVADQSPCVSFNGTSPSLQENYFLSSALARTKSPYLVYHDKRYNWCIKCGVIHGVSVGDEVLINDQWNSKIIAQPEPGISQIPSNLQFGKTDSFYFGVVTAQPRKRLKISFSRSITAQAKLWITEAYRTGEYPYIELLDSRVGQFMIWSNNGFFISLPDNEEPIIEPIAVDSTNSAGYFLRQLSLISKWINLQELENSSGTLNSNQFKLRLFTSTLANVYRLNTFSEIEIKPINTFGYQSGYQPAFRLSIFNKGYFPFWICIAYMGFDYSIDASFYRGVQVLPDHELFVTIVDKNRETDIIPLKVDEKYLRRNYYEITEYLKLFLSVRELDISGLQQDGVGLPSHMGGKTGEENAFLLQTAGTKVKEWAPNDWTTQLIGLKIVKTKP